MVKSINIPAAVLRCLWGVEEEGLSMVQNTGLTFRKSGFNSQLSYRFLVENPGPVEVKVNFVIDFNRARVAPFSETHLP